jgi:hypothetical protein
MQRKNTDFAFSNLTGSQVAASAVDGRELSNAELAGVLRHAAEQGRLPSWHIRNLVAKRIEEAELTTLFAKQRAYEGV